MKNMAVCLILLFFSVFTTGTVFFFSDDHAVFENNQAQVLNQEHMTAGLVLVPEGVVGRNTTNAMRYQYDVYVPEGKTLISQMTSLYLIKDGENLGNPDEILSSNLTVLDVEVLTQGSLYRVELTIQIKRVTCPQTLALLPGSSVRFSPQFVAE